MTLTQTTIRLPDEIYAAARSCAAEVGISFNAFTCEAIASRVRNWKSPITGRKTAPQHNPATRGKWCVPCNVTAAACKNPAMHKESLWSSS